MDERLRDKAKLLDVKGKITEFAKCQGCEKVAEKMQHIRRWRNKIVHPKDLATILEFMPHPVPVLELDSGEYSFKQFQEDCFEIDDEIRQKFGKELRMKEIMIPTLKYDMGNAGDIIKHGLLAEFVKWHKERGGKELRFADSFGGCPWGNLSSVVQKRLVGLKNTALLEVYTKTEDKYYGSSHLVRKVAEKHRLAVRIDISDNDPKARCNLGNSIKKHGFMELIELPSDNNGYKILDNGQKYNLILLDPYSEFLRDEFYFDNRNKVFNQILNLIKTHKDLFIAVFVLDMNSQNQVGRRFSSFKQKDLSNCTFSLRCPKLLGDTGIKGEDKFDSEILLISQQIANGKCDKLRESLRAFAKVATKALSLQNSEVGFWS